FQLLTGGSRTSLPHQRTLEAVVTWSYALLNPAEQALFRRLAVFADSFTLEEAEAVGGGGLVPPGSVLDVLSQLVGKSLVSTVSDGVDLRYSMIEPLRPYAATRPAPAGQVVAAPDRPPG